MYVSIIGVQMLQSLNPATGDTVESFDSYSDEMMDEILRRSQRAFELWESRPFDERARLMMNAASALREKKVSYAEIISREMGKPVSQSLAEIEKCAIVCEYYAVQTEKILSMEIIPSDASISYVRFDPLGVILAVMPWNFPFWQVFRFAAPALMAGNTAVLKHASNVPCCALSIEEVFRAAGFPEDCFRTLLIPSHAVAAVIRHPAVAAVTLTGSEASGMSVAGIAGSVLKKSVLELGGSDPFIVLKDADLQAAAVSAAQARLVNSGQSCIAAKRFIVEETVAEEFEQRFVEAMKCMKVGDPMDPTTDVGPIAREDLRHDLHDQVLRSIALGARLLLGGAFVERRGFYYEPTILSNVKKGMPVYDEEVFGPVAAVIRVRDVDDAIAVANDSRYGLGSALWTNDLQQAGVLAARIESGCVFVNGIVKSDPRLPFGGIKQSGYGRELSHYGIKEFINIKTVWMK